MTEPASGWPTRVAVVGAGTMGIGISHVFATSGIPTVLVDATAELSEAALTRSLELLRRLEEDGNVERGAGRTAEQHLLAAPSIDDAVRGADLVVEAVVERADVKIAVYAAIEAAANDEAVVATNTSSIPIAQLAVGLRRPQRFLGVHWFVPPLLVPCVEVIRTAATADDVVEQVVDALTRLGKTPVVVGDGPGFVANRIQFVMFREAARIVEEGVAAPEQVDEVVRSSFGFRLPFFGPFTIADMAGLDVYADIFDTLEGGLGEGFAAPRAPAGARRPRGIRRQDGTRFPRAVPGAGRRADRPQEPRVRRARPAQTGAGGMTAIAPPMLPTQRLDGRHAIVTGAGRGIGRATALALAEAGASVTLFSRSEDELAAVADEVRQRGVRAETCVGDVRSAADVERLVETAAADDGLSICVTAAGLNRPGPTLEQPIEDFDLVVETNLRGTYLTCRAFAAAVEARGRGGRIVAISSQMGEVGYPGRAAYCASKHAVNGLVKALAVEWAPGNRGQCGCADVRRHAPDTTHVRGRDVPGRCSAALADGAHRHAVGCRRRCRLPRLRSGGVGHGTRARR